MSSGRKATADLSGRIGRLIVDGIEITVTRKRIKNVYLSVHLPTGEVRLSAPFRMSEAELRRFVQSKSDWLERKLRESMRRPPRTEPRFVDGEGHPFLGRSYVLRVIEDSGRRSRVVLIPESSDESSTVGEIHLYVRAQSTEAERGKILEDFYRAELQRLIPRYLEKWEPIVGVKVTEWRVRKMKTRWGSCNIAQRRIWISLALAKYDPKYLEYVIVHELAHLHERLHNDRFKRRMDAYLPDWRIRRRELNRAAR
ncbi:MAG: M48 family metallopeptidase [Clostridiaceae bacterium]|nr:M48 family metallopeptidase [Clostridiaceae bacterium]